MANQYRYTWEVMNWMKDFFTANKLGLGLQYIGYGDEELIPGYPAIVISQAPRDKRIGGTHKFETMLRVDLWILHANLNVGKQQRTYEDMLLASAIESMLDANMTLPTNDEPLGNIVNGFVVSETPGIMHRRTGNSTSQVVGTRLQWEGQSRPSF